MVGALRLAGWDVPDAGRQVDLIPAHPTQILASLSGEKCQQEVITPSGWFLRNGLEKGWKLILAQKALSASFCEALNESDRVGRGLSATHRVIPYSGQQCPELVSRARMSLADPPGDVLDVGRRDFRKRSFRKRGEAPGP